MQELGGGYPNPRRGPLFPSLKRRRRRSGPPLWGVVLVALLAGGVVFGWLRFGPRADADPVAPPAQAATAADPMTPSTDPAEGPLVLPDLDLSDEFVRRLLAHLSSHPQWVAWLVPDDLVRRFVAAVVDVASGSSPATPLDFLIPTEPFRARPSAGRLFIDPASHRRYDLMTAVFVSVDAGDAARLYPHLQPLFEEAYSELGVADPSFDDLLALAIRNLLAVEVPEGALEIRPKEAVYEFADPAIERLSPAEKHLFRLGYENARRLQAQIRRVSEALALAVPD